MEAAKYGHEVQKLMGIPSGFSRAADSSGLSQCEVVIGDDRHKVINDNSDADFSHTDDGKSVLGESIIDLDIFDRALSGDAKVSLMVNRGKDESANEQERPVSQSTEIVADSYHPLQEQDSTWESNFSWSDDGSQGGGSRGQRSVVISNGENRRIVSSPVEVVYVATDCGEIEVVLGEGFGDAARLMVKDISASSPYNVRITVQNKTRIEHYNRKGEIVCNVRGTYLLNSHRGAVTFRYHRPSDVWVIESQLVGSCRPTGR
jgi:hypothetical protein